MATKRWQDDSVQFPRLLAEIHASGLTRNQYHDLEASMDLTSVEIDELLERAENAWETIKTNV